jgi:hypothetical protein
VPCGIPTPLTGAAARAALRLNRPGIYQCTVRIPQSRIPPLPMRYRSRLIWPYGTLQGRWSHVDLYYATCFGAEILDVESAIVYAEERPLYAEYERFVFDQRRTSQCTQCRDGVPDDDCKRCDNRWREWAKWTGNALSGKLAQGPEMESLRMTDKPQRKWRWLGGRAHVQVTRRPADSARPFQAAVLTARARHVQWLRLREAKTPVYGDTDSAVTGDEQREFGGAIGEWKNEGEFVQWDAFGPKGYRCIRARDGKKIVKIKGLPGVTWESFDAYRRGEGVHNAQGVQGLRSALSREGRAFVRRDLTRKSNAPMNVCGDRWREEDGSTSPLERDRDGALRWPSTSVLPEDVL